MQNIEDVAASLEQALLELQNSASLIQNTIQFLNGNTMGYTDQEIISIVQNGQDATHRFVTDTEKALWNSGGGAIPFWFPESYGVTGNGTTNDAAGFQAMHDAMPSRGGYVFLSAKKYIINTQVNISKPITFVGSGAFDLYVSGIEITTLATTSATIKMFKVTSPSVTFQNIGFLNSASTPSAGTAISFDNTTGNYLLNPNNFRIIDCSIAGFYDNISIVNSSNWIIRGCYISNPVRFGIDINNVLLPDGGDAIITECNIYPGLRPAVAGIHHTAGGGLKLSLTKFNGGGANVFDYCYWGENIDNTIDLNVSICGFENYKRSAFRIISTTGFSQVQIGTSHFASSSSSPEPDIYTDHVSDMIVSGNGFVSGGTKQVAIAVSNGNNIRFSNSYHGYDAIPERENTCTNVKASAWTDVTTGGGIPDLTPPTVAAAVAATSTTVVVTFSESVTGTSTGWSFKLNGTNNPVVSMTGSGNTRTFTLTNAMASGDVILRSYNSGTGNIADLSSNLLASFTDAAVTNTIGGGGGGGTTIIDDQFEMANGTLLSAWTPAPVNVPTAVWTAPSNFAGFGQKVSVTGVGGVLIATLDAGIHDGTASIVVNRSTDAADMGFIFRYTDANNYFFVDFSAGANTFTIFERVAGSNISRATISKTFATNTDYVLNITLSGTLITADVDGGSILTYTSSNNQTATKFGLWVVNSGPVTYNNLLITD